MVRACKGALTHPLIYNSVLLQLRASVFGKNSQRRKGVCVDGEGIRIQGERTRTTVSFVTEISACVCAHVG